MCRARPGFFFSPSRASTLIDGISALTNIEARIKADSGNINSQGIDISASHDAYMYFSTQSGTLADSAAKVAKLVITAQAMAADIRAAIAAGGLSVSEVEQLQGILADIVGDAELAEAYIAANTVNIDNNIHLRDNDSTPIYNAQASYKLEGSRKNVNDFIAGKKSFEEVLDDYATIYSDAVNSNLNWSWNKTILGGELLTGGQKSRIKKASIEQFLIPDVNVNPIEGMKYGFADFRGAGVVSEIISLPESMWYMADVEQFAWLDEIIGGHQDGMTWHHSEIPGQMELVPFGIHNITPHNGGRTTGMWADAKR